MKVLSMFSSKRSLREMGLSDNGKCLDQLTREKTMGFFRNLFLVYSFEDGYSPLYSSKIVVEGADETQRKMCEDFWKNVKVN